MDHEIVRGRIMDEVRGALLSVISELKRHHGDLAKIMLEELEKLVNSREFHGIIAYPEFPVDRGRIDVDVFNSIIFELKSSESEFAEGEKALREKYVPGHGSASYAVLTNYEKWRFYKVDKGDIKLIAEVSREKAREKLKEIFSEILRGKWGLYPRPEIIVELFKDVIEEYREPMLNILSKYIDDEDVKPFYTVFKSVAQSIYSDLSENEIKNLYVTHTLLQMIVASALADALNIEYGDSMEKCRGSLLPVEIVLPYLTWWYTLYRKLSDDEKKTVKDLTSAISLKSSIVNWRARAVEDVFRELYEAFIDSETRRKIGEYYTPIWLVEFTIEKLKEKGVVFRDKVVLDPFCGSGTFLVMAFYEKLREGEDPQKAILEVVGLDINPLAVSIARAELLLAYIRSLGTAEVDSVVPPLVFHVDTFQEFMPMALTKFFSAGVSRMLTYLSEQFTELRDVRRIFAEFTSSLISKPEFRRIDRVEILRGIQELEKRLLMALREAALCIKKGGEDPDSCIRKCVAAWFDPRRFTGSNVIISEFSKFITVDENLKVFADAMSGILAKYGNDVWASPLIAILATRVLNDMKADTVLTNPPWAELTRFNAPYKEMVKNIAKYLVTKTGIQDAEKVLMGSDISAFALHIGIGLAREAVGYVMPRESTFYHRSSQRVGQALTYAVLKNAEESIETADLIDLDYDAFAHGNIPALVVIKKGQPKTGVKLYKVSVEVGERYSKSLKLGSVKVELEPLSVEYEEFLEPLLEYLRGDREALASKLGAVKIMPKGCHIMGLFGGEKKKGKVQYAGLVITDAKYSGGFVRFRLYNMTHYLEDEEKEFEKRKYILIYGGNIYPFYLSNTYLFLFSKENDLKEYLERLLKLNARNLGDEAKHLGKLKEEVKASGSPLTQGNWYVVYRRMRAFASLVFKPDSDRYVIPDNVSAIDLGRGNDAEAKAYYYAGVLNYMIYKADKLGIGLIRGQFARPLYALSKLGLSWSDMNSSTREKVVELSKKLHEVAPRVLRGSVKKMTKVETAFKILETSSYTKLLLKELVNIIDVHLSSKELKEKDIAEILSRWIGGAGEED